MAKLGSHKRPAVVHVQSQERAETILSLCNEHEWQVIIGLEPDKPEDISDVKKLLDPPLPNKAAPKVERNAPCPCGSGKKFKKCCIGNPESISPEDGSTVKFQFEPGSYGGVDHFIPSIACLKGSSGSEWKYHFVLVNPNISYPKEHDAVSHAESDLNQAFKQKQRVDSDYALAKSLKAKGYLSVKDFKIAEEKV